MTRLHVMFVLLLTGCLPSPGLVTGTTGIISQQGYTLNTTQKCVDAASAVQIADVALPIYLQHLTEAGYIKHAETIVDGRFAVCLVELPEPCSFAGVIKGPFGPTPAGEKYPLAARKRGCASGRHAWSSKSWPPVCRDVWPNEPHCVAGTPMRDDWRLNYLHELFNMVVLRWTDVYKPDYQAAIYKVVEPVAIKAALEAIKKEKVHD